MSALHCWGRWGGGLVAAHGSFVELCAAVGQGLAVRSDRHVRRWCVLVRNGAGKLPDAIGVRSESGLGFLVS